MKYLILLISIFGLLACTDINKGNQIEAIDEMLKTCDSIQTVLVENEIDTIAALSTAANMVEIRIKNNYYADTIDMELGKKMDAYKVMRRTFGPLGRSYSVIKKGSQEEIVALNNLKSDIENGDGKRSSYKDYVLFEKNKVEQLKVLLKDYVVQKEKTMKTFNELHEELDQFSMELATKKHKI